MYYFEPRNIIIIQVNQPFPILILANRNISLDDTIAIGPKTASRRRV